MIGDVLHASPERRFTGRWSLMWETNAQMHLENGQWYLSISFWNTASMIIPKIKLLSKAIILLDKKREGWWIGDGWSSVFCFSWNERCLLPRFTSLSLFVNGWVMPLSSDSFTTILVKAQCMLFLLILTDRGFSEAKTP